MVEKKRKQVAQVATSLSQPQKANESQKTAAEREEIAGEKAVVPPPGNELEAYMGQLEVQLAEADRIVKAVVRGKSPPPVKRPRPAGEYLLISPYWDGRLRHPSGDKFTFPEGLAPQSAKYLDKS